MGFIASTWSVGWLVYPSPVPVTTREEAKGWDWVVCLVFFLVGEGEGQVHDGAEWVGRGREGGTEDRREACKGRRGANGCCVIVSLRTQGESKKARKFTWNL